MEQQLVMDNLVFHIVRQNEHIDSNRTPPLLALQLPIRRVAIHP